VRIAILSLILLFAEFSFGDSLSFEKIQTFHDQKVKMLIENYALEGKVDFTVLISPVKNNESKAATDKVRLPGLILGGIDSFRKPDTSSLFEIFNQLGSYKRKITFIKKRHVDAADIEALEAGVKEYLVLGPSDTVQTVDGSFSFVESLRNVGADLGSSIYKSFFQSNLFAILILASVLLFIFLSFMSSILNKTFGKLGDSIENSAASHDMSESYQSLDEDHSQDLLTEATVTKNSQKEELLADVDLTSLRKKLEEVYRVSKYELFGILWRHLSTPDKQISFYELMVKSESASDNKLFQEIFFEVFNIQPESLSEIGQGETLKNSELAQLYKNLLVAKLVEKNPLREKALSGVYPKHGKNLEKAIEATLEQFFNVVYYLFPGLVAKVLSEDSNLAERLSQKVLSQVAKTSVDNQPTEIEVESFVKHISSLEPEDILLASGAKLDPKRVQLLYNIPDSSIWKMQDLKEEMKSLISLSLPNLVWVNNSNPAKLKSFLMSLSGEELVYLSQEHQNYESLLSSLDERGVFRIQEKIADARNSEAGIELKQLRGKIKKFFAPVKYQGQQDVVFRNAA